MYIYIYNIGIYISSAKHMCEPFQILDANPKVQQMGVEICRDFFQGISSLTSSTTESAAADDNDILCFFLDLDMQDLGWWIVYSFNRFQTVSIGFNMILYDINDITWTSWSTQASKLPLVPSCGTMSRWSLSNTCHKNLMLTLTYGSFPSNFPLIFPTPRTTPTPLFLHVRGTLQISSSHFWEVLSDIINHSDITHDKLVDSSRR